MKLMKAEQIPTIRPGRRRPRPRNLRHWRCYVFGDADLPIERVEELAPEFLRINETYGCRFHLKPEIIA